MDFPLSTITAPSNTKKILDQIKLEKKHRYLVLRLNNNLIEVATIGKKEEKCEDLLKNIKTHVSQYVLYHYQSEELPHFDDKYILIAWIPDSDRLYGSALMYVKHAVGVENVLIVRDVRDLDAGKLEAEIRKCLDCLFNENIVRAPPIPYVPDSRGLGFVYYNCMLQNKEKTALIEGVTGNTMTYGTLLERAISLAVNLRKKGVKYGDVISYHGYEQMDCSAIFIATFFLGATICAVDPTFSRDDVTSMLEQVTPTKVFVAVELLAMIEEILENIGSGAEIIVLGDSDEYAIAYDLLQKTDDDVAFRPVEAHSILDTAVIVFTSGSTGVPKPVCHNHEAALYQYYSFANLGHCWETILHFATPHWTIYSKFLGIQILLGTARVFYRSFFETFWDFTKYNVTIAFCSPVEIMTLSKIGRPDKIDLSKLDIIVGGNTIDEKQTKLLHSAFYDVGIFIGYGFSEIPNGMTAFNPGSPEDLQLKQKKTGSVGRALPGFSFKIVDPETEEILGPNQQGEIRVKTSFFLSGYWKGDLLSLWDSYGWMRPGDLAIRDDDRCLYVVGRLKDMFKYQDYHIIPAIIENVIKTHPGVLQAAVIGVPHLVDGHHPLGVVVLKPDHTVTVEELLEYTDERVHYSHKLRAGLKIVDKMPLTSGKVRKVVLRKMILNGM